MFVEPHSPDVAHTQARQHELGLGQADRSITAGPRSNTMMHLVSPPALAYHQTYTCTKLNQNIDQNVCRNLPEKCVFNILAAIHHTDIFLIAFRLQF